MKCLKQRIKIIQKEISIESNVKIKKESFRPNCEKVMTKLNKHLDNYI